MAQLRQTFLLPRADEAALSPDWVARIVANNYPVKGELLNPSPEYVTPLPALGKALVELFTGDRLMLGGFAPLPLNHASAHVGAFIEQSLARGDGVLGPYVHHSIVAAHAPEFTHGFHGGTVLMHTVRELVGWLDPQRVDTFMSKQGLQERGSDFGFFLADRMEYALSCADASGVAEAFLEALKPHLSPSDIHWLSRGLVTSHDLRAFDAAFPASTPSLQVRSLGVPFERIDEGGKGPWELHMAIPLPGTAEFPVRPVVVIEPPRTIDPDKT